MADAVVNCAVGEHGKTVATDIFFKFGRQERPAVVPPHAINGGSADQGGTYNAVGGGSGPTTAASPSPSPSDGNTLSEDEGGEDGEEGGEEAAEVAKESAVPKPLNPGTDKYRPGKKGVRLPHTPLWQLSYAHPPHTPLPGRDAILRAAPCTLSTLWAWGWGVLYLGKCTFGRALPSRTRMRTRTRPRYTNPPP